METEEKSAYRQLASVRAGSRQTLKCGPCFRLLHLHHPALVSRQLLAFSWHRKRAGCERIFHFHIAPRASGHKYTSARASLPSRLCMYLLHTHAKMFVSAHTLAFAFCYRICARYCVNSRLTSLIRRQKRDFWRKQERSTEHQTETINFSLGCSKITKLEEMKQ